MTPRISTQRDFHLNIRRLILDGIDIPAHQRPMLRAAIETELAHLMEANSQSARWQVPGAFSSLQAGNIELTPDGNILHLGQQIARAIFEGSDL
jgi:hypothetical protein